SGVLDRDHLRAGVAVAALIDSRPTPCRRESITAESVGRCIHDHDPVSAAIIRGRTGWIKVPGRAALDGFVGYTGDSRWSGVLDRDHLRAGVAVAALIDSRPASCRREGVTAECVRGRVHDHDPVSAAVIGGCTGWIKVPCRAALNRFVGYTGDSRWSGVLDRN